MWECKFCGGTIRYKKGYEYFCRECNKSTQSESQPKGKGERPEDKAVADTVHHQ